MPADRPQRRLLLDEARGAKDDLTSAGIVPPVLEEPPRTLDAEHGFDGEADIRDLLRELVRMVEERGREPLRPLDAGWIPVLAVSQVALDESHKGGVAKEALSEAVEKGRKA